MKGPQPRPRHVGSQEVPSGDGAAKKGQGGRRAYEAIREKILSLELEPGLDLDEALIAEQLSITRTPLREALIRLASEQLVVILPNRGARVAELSLNSIREFFEALTLTQRAVTRWAAIRAPASELARVKAHMGAFERAADQQDGRAMAAANREFHIAIGSCAQNRYLAGINRQLLDEGMRLSRLAVLYDPPRLPSRSDHLSGIIEEHRNIVAAIETGMADRAEQLALAHSERFRQRIMDYMLSPETEVPTIEP